MKKTVLKWKISLLTVIAALVAGNQAVLADGLPNPQPIIHEDLLLLAAFVVSLAIIAFFIITAIRNRKNKD